MHSKKLSQLGFTLVELMITLLLSSIFMLAVTRIFSETANVYKFNTDQLTIMETSRFALKDITEDIQRAGYMGCVSSEDYDDGEALSDGTENTERVNDSLEALSDGSRYGSEGMRFQNAVYGVEGGSNPDVLNVVYQNDLDIRVLSFEGFGDLAAYKQFAITEAANIPSRLSAGDLLTITDCATASPFVLTADIETISVPAGSNFSESGVKTAGLFAHSAVAINGFRNNPSTFSFYDMYASGGAAYIGELFHVTYLVAPSKIDQSGNYNALFRLVNGEDPSIDNELITRVKDFQVQYGTRVVDEKDGLPDQYIDASNNMANNISSVLLTITLDKGTQEEELQTVVNIRNRGL